MERLRNRWRKDGKARTWGLRLATAASLAWGGAAAEFALAQQLDPALDGPAITNTLEGAEEGTGVWPAEPSVVRDLEALREFDEARIWANRTLAALLRLQRAKRLGDDDASGAIERLEQLSQEAMSADLPLAPGAARNGVVRTGRAIDRRVAIWRKVHELNRHPGDSVAAAFDIGAWQRQMSQFDESLGRGAEADSWRNYLLLGDAFRVSANNEPGARLLARRMLSRIASPDLSDQQRSWLRWRTESIEPILRETANEPVDYVQFLKDLELFESSSGASGAAALGFHYQRLRWSSDPRARELAQQIDAHYRGANLRVAVREDLLERFLPQAAPEQAPVSDTILGAEVEGQSLTKTRLGLRFIPDDRRIRMALEVSGDVFSRTTASVGPATFHNDGMSQFTATKEILVGPDGITALGAEAIAEDDSQVAEIETDFDSVPLVGSLARAIAMKQREDQESDIAYEVESRVAERARQRLDEEVDRRLEEAEQRFAARVLAPLRKINLHPATIAAGSTSDRLHIFARVASDDQFSAISPRPLAPGDSLASVQIHESTINNVLEQLRFHGRREKLPVLIEELAGVLKGSRAPLPPEIAEELPDDVEIEFAETDPVRVRFENDSAVLSLSIAELSAGRRAWYDFTVIARFQAKREGLQVAFSRAGHIELKGEDLNFRDQVALRGVFTKVFASQRVVRLAPETFVNDQRLANLEVTQCVASEGWLGLAVGPRARVARREGSQPQ